MNETKHDDGGAAFPVPYVDPREEIADALCGRPRVAQRGMSLLDYFAAHAPGQVSDDADMEWLSVRTGMPLPENMKNGVEMADWWARAEASLRYRYAAAMLAEREARRG